MCEVVAVLVAQFCIESHRSHSGARHASQQWRGTGQKIRERLTDALPDTWQAMAMRIRNAKLSTCCSRAGLPSLHISGRSWGKRGVGRRYLRRSVRTGWSQESSNRFGESHGRGGSASCSDNLSRFTELVHAAATDDDDDDDDDDNHDDDDDDDYDDDDDNHDDDVPGRPPILLLQEICGRVTMDQGETCHPEVADMGATGLG